MIDVMQVQLESGAAYVLTANVYCVLPTHPAKPDRSLLCMDGFENPIEVRQPVAELAALWLGHLVAEPDYYEASEEVSS